MSEYLGDLGKALDVYRHMTLLVDTCKHYKGDLDMWDIQWDTFWDLSNDFPFRVEWCDMDTSYEEDIIARYLAIDDFMQGFRVDLQMKHNLKVWKSLERDNEY